MLNIPLPAINNDLFNLCENDPTKRELWTSLKSMENNKATGNDGLTKEFFKKYAE